MAVAKAAKYNLRHLLVDYSIDLCANHNVLRRADSPAKIGNSQSQCQQKACDGGTGNFPVTHVHNKRPRRAARLRRKPL